MPNPLTIEDLIVLVDNGENAFTILGETVRVLQMSDHSEEEIKAYVREATSSDYEHLREVTQRYIQNLAIGKA